MAEFVVFVSLLLRKYAATSSESDKERHVNVDLWRERHGENDNSMAVKSNPQHVHVGEEQRVQVPKWG